jgi:apolipoprotein N-acyltransferase
MDWQPLLQPGESLRWQGRPAPRCWTFRNWRHSLFGMLLLPFTIWWLGIGISLGRENAAPWLFLLSLPVFLAALYLALGHLLLARLEWEQVFYAITDQRILVRKGLRGQIFIALPLEQIGSYRLLSQGESLGSVRLFPAGSEHRLTLSCIEYPLGATTLLDGALDKAVDRRQMGTDSGEIV